MTTHIQPKRAFAPLSRLSQLAQRATYIEQQSKVGRLIAPTTAEHNMMVALMFARVATAGVFVYGALVGGNALYKSAAEHMQRAHSTHVQPRANCNPPVSTPQAGWTTAPSNCGPK